ncbi:hypothetical protein HK098_001869 [Nowakowskiella sp. JEL0407]|nr:hypothetical protein HK098_001869 [Nowakowskiella sp. JEL0407]
MEFHKTERDILRQITSQDPRSTLSPLAVIASHFLGAFTNDANAAMDSGIVPLSATFHFMKQYFGVGSSFDEEKLKEVRSHSPALINEEEIKGWRKLMISYPAIGKKNLPLLIPLAARDWLFVDFIFAEKASILLAVDENFGTYLSKNSAQSPPHSPHLHDSLIISAMNYLSSASENFPIGLLFARTLLLQDSFCHYILPQCCTPTPKLVCERLYRFYVTRVEKGKNEANLLFDLIVHEAVALHNKLQANDDKCDHFLRTLCHFLALLIKTEGESLDLWGRLSDSTWSRLREQHIEIHSSDGGPKNSVLQILYKAMLYFERTRRIDKVNLNKYDLSWRIYFVNANIGALIAHMFWDVTNFIPESKWKLVRLLDKIDEVDLKSKDKTLYMDKDFASILGAGDTSVIASFEPDPQILRLLSVTGDSKYAITPTPEQLSSTFSSLTQLIEKKNSPFFKEITSRNDVNVEKEDTQKRSNDELTNDDPKKSLKKMKTSNQLLDAHPRILDELISGDLQQEQIVSTALTAWTNFAVLSTNDSMLKAIDEVLNCYPCGTQRILDKIFIVFILKNGIFANSLVKIFQLPQYGQKTNEQLQQSPPLNTLMEYISSLNPDKLVILYRGRINEDYKHGCIQILRALSNNPSLSNHATFFLLDALKSAGVGFQRQFFEEIIDSKFKTSNNLFLRSKSLILIPEAGSLLPVYAEVSITRRVITADGKMTFVARPGAARSNALKLYFTTYTEQVTDFLGMIFKQKSNKDADSLSVSLVQILCELEKVKGDWFVKGWLPPLIKSLRESLVSGENVGFSFFSKIISPKTWLSSPCVRSAESFSTLIREISLMESQQGNNSKHLKASSIWQTMWVRYISWNTILSLVEFTLQIYPRIPISFGCYSLAEDLLLDLCENMSKALVENDKFPRARVDIKGESMNSIVVNAISELVQTLFRLNGINDENLDIPQKRLFQSVTNAIIAQAEPLQLIFSAEVERYISYLSMRIQNQYHNPPPPPQPSSNNKNRNSDINVHLERIKVLIVTAEAIAVIIESTWKEDFWNIHVGLFGKTQAVQSWLLCLRLAHEMINPASNQMVIGLNHQYVGRLTNAICNLLTKVYYAPNAKKGMYADRIEKGCARILEVLRPEMELHLMAWEASVKLIVECLMFPEAGRSTTTLLSALIPVLEEYRCGQLFKEAEELGTKKSSILLSLQLKPLIDASQVGSLNTNHVKREKIIEMLQAKSNFNGTFTSLLFQELWVKLEGTENVDSLLEAIKIIIKCNKGIPYASMIGAAVSDALNEYVVDLTGTYTTKISLDILMEILIEIVGIRGYDINPDLIYRLMEKSVRHFRQLLESDVTNSTGTSLSPQMIQNLCRVGIASVDFINHFRTSKEFILETFAIGMIQSDEAVSQLCLEGFEKARKLTYGMRKRFGSAVVDQVVVKVQNAVSFSLKKRAQCVSMVK